MPRHTCPACGGNGDCHRCSGTGHTVPTTEHPNGIPCPNCNGSGKCSRCEAPAISSINYHVRSLHAPAA
jgi:hypothetical protein